MTARRAIATFVLLGAAASAWAEPLTLPHAKRPQWVRRDGIVMAGSWEPLVFRVRRDGTGYTPNAQQLADWQQEHSPEMVQRLKALGVNFVMMHCYKGAGLEAERQSMDDAVRFAKQCHEAGMRVGVYNFSGAFLWEPLFKEIPQAKDWVVLQPDGTPVTYGSARYRYYWNRNHPQAVEFYQKLVRFAVQEIRADLLHFDNYVVGPGYDAVSVARFREFLRTSFSAEELKAMGLSEASAAQPPGPGSPAMLRRAWQEFCTDSLAESYWAMSRYARSLRPDVLIECNPNGVPPVIRPPVDHGRLLQGGEAFWVESGRVGLRDGHLVTRIRHYKVGRAMDNMTFDYTLTPLEMAESMAFNLDCLGCIGWFEYGKIVSAPGAKDPASPDLQRFVDFFHKRRDLLREARVVADVAVLRSFPSMAFGDPQIASLTPRVEDLLIQHRACFQILHEHQLGDLTRYKVLVLAGCAALGDSSVEHIRRFVSRGGKLCVIGPVATHDRWMQPRPKPALDDLPASAVVRAEEKDDWLAAIRRAGVGAFSLSFGDATPIGLCAELTEQTGRRLVHLVNYRSDGPVRNITVQVRLPQDQSVQSVTLVSPEAADRPAGFERVPQGVQFRVPEIGIYQIAVIRLANRPSPAMDPGAAKRQ